MADDLTLSITRWLSAPPEAVFAAWIEPQQLAEWYGPGVFSNADVEVDARAGGRFQVVMVSPDGNRYPAGGEFIEVDPPDRLVYRDTSGELSQEFVQMVRAQLIAAGADPDTDVQSIVTVTFERVAEGTQLTITTAFSSEAARQALVGMRMVDGWNESLDTLERHFA